MRRLGRRAQWYFTTRALKSKRAQRWGRDAARLRIACGGLTLIAVLSGCSRPQEKDEVSRSSDMPLFAHPGSCRRCHDQLTRNVPTAAPPENVCSTPDCHPSFSTVPSYVHAPVALADCGLCHVPHSSTEHSLLTRPEADLCGFCHTRLRTCPSKDQPAPASCTSCHNPHGADTHYLLRAVLGDSGAQRFRNSG